MNGTKSRLADDNGLFTKSIKCLPRRIYLFISLKLACRKPAASCEFPTTYAKFPLTIMMVALAQVKYFSELQKNTNHINKHIKWIGV